MEKTKFTKEVTLGLVRNTVYRENIFDSKDTHHPYVDPYGNQTTQYVNNSQKTDTVKTTE